MNRIQARIENGNLIGKRGKKLRLKKGMSHQQIAEKADCCRSSVALIELGNRIPSAYILAGICIALDCSSDYLLGIYEDE